MFQLFDVVRLKWDDPDAGVPKGTAGTIVDVMGAGEAYTVEFVDDDGETYEKALLKEYSADWFELLWRSQEDGSAVSPDGRLD